MPKTARFVDGLRRGTIQDFRRRAPEALMDRLKVLNRRLTGISHEGISNLPKYALGS